MKYYERPPLRLTFGQNTYCPMIRNSICAFLLLAAFITSSCNKTENTSANQFTINGIHDVTLGSTNPTPLSFTVALSKGAQEQVTISVSGVPSGINVVIDPVNGTPAFGGFINFSWDGTAAAGTYPIKVTGTSASYTKSYDLNLIVPS